MKGIGGWDIPHGEGILGRELRRCLTGYYCCFCGMHSVVVAMSVSMQEKKRERESCPAIIVAEKM